MLDRFKGHSAPSTPSQTVSPLVRSAGVLALVAAGLLTTKQAKADCRWTNPKTDVAPGAPVVVDVNGTDAKSAIRVKEGATSIAARGKNAAGPHMATGVSATLTAPNTPGVHKVVLSSESCPANERDKTIFLRVAAPSTATTPGATPDQMTSIDARFKKLSTDLQEHKDKPADDAHADNGFRLGAGWRPSLRKKDTSSGLLRLESPLVSNEDGNVSLNLGAEATVGVGHIPSGTVGGAQENGRTTWFTATPFLGARFGLGGKYSTYKKVDGAGASGEVALYKKEKNNEGERSVVEVDLSAGPVFRTQSGSKEVNGYTAAGQPTFADAHYQNSIAFGARAGVSVYPAQHWGFRVGLGFETGKELTTQGAGTGTSTRYDVTLPITLEYRR